MRIGKYEIQEILGQGGFGVVYKAHDTVLNVTRAVKVLHQDLLRDYVFLERFKQEARLAARLEHPGIVPVYDYGETDGRFYLAMKYMPGGALKELLANKGRLSKDEALAIFSQICDGLDYAHKQGVIHRDLKPGNILLDADGSARVSDMGFAKAVSANPSLSLSTSGGILGTPSYIAPEIWRGAAATPASDQYSLACILYEMLTGQVLFAGNSPVDIMTRHVMDGPSFSAELPKGVDIVLKKGLAKDPAERYAHLEDMVVALTKTEGVGRDRGGSRTGNNGFGLGDGTGNLQGSEKPGGKFVERKRLPWLVLGALAFLGLGALMTTLLQNRGAAEQPEPTMSQPAVLAVVNTAVPTSTHTAAPTNTDTPVPTMTHTAAPTHTNTTAPTNTEMAEVIPTGIPEIEGMVYVPEGEFQMGCDPDHNAGFECIVNELPLHTVYLDAYYIDKYEVSNAQYAACVEAGVCAKPRDYGYWSSPENSLFSNPTYANYSVFGISWFDARDYCTWAGKRLPTEAEWEKAARGTSPIAFPWGDDEPSCGLANGDSCEGMVSEVSAYPYGASPYGALNMAGNVFEWVQDWHSSNYYSSSPYENPTGPSGGSIKVLRGGSYSRDWQYLRTANRVSASPDPNWSYYTVGFRCATSAGSAALESIEVTNPVQSVTSTPLPYASDFSGLVSLEIPDYGKSYTWNYEYADMIYDTLFVGNNASNDWPKCSGAIESIRIQSLISDYDFLEEFNTPEDFSQIGSTVYVSNGKAVFDHIWMDGGPQFIYRDIPEVSGPLKITVIGQMDWWQNNCGVVAGISNNTITSSSQATGEFPGVGYSWFGGGCSMYGPLILANGIPNAYVSDGCSFTSDGAAWVDSGKPVKTILLIN